MADDNGKYPAEGRFLRIEGAIDKLAEDLTDFRLEVSSRLDRIEQAALTRNEVSQQRVSARAYRWMVVGIASSFGLGVLTFLWRIVS